MLYYLVRPLATVALRVFLRHIRLAGTEHIPREKPVVLAVNHPTAFMEACLLACFLDRPLYFLVRGDIFVKPLYIKLLRALHMLPMYRLKDRGYAFVKANFETFDACFEALRARKTIMILAEGHTRAEKRLQPLKKGTARLAFGAIDKYPELEDVYIVPVGVNFDYVDRAGADAIVSFGAPMSARVFYEQYRHNSIEGTEAFTNELARRMRQQMVIVQDKADDTLAERLLVMARSEMPGNAPQRLQTEMTTTQRLNTLPDDDKAALAQMTQTYFDALANARLDDRAVFENRKPQWQALPLLALALPLTWLGRLFHWPPAALAKYIADTRVRSIEFYAPVWLAVALALFLLYYIAWGAVAGMLWGAWGLLALLALAFLGYAEIHLRAWLRRWLLRWRWSRTAAKTQRQLTDMRAHIREKFATASVG